MKHIILPLLCCIVILSCKKENASPILVESSSQQLTNISRTGEFGGGTYTVAYQFNSAGKLIKEDNKTYERDARQRIVTIKEAGATINGIPVDERITKVYYNNISNQVAYTIWGTDSVAYIHDDKGRLVKTMSYLKSGAQPETIYLEEYTIIAYDAAGNLLTTDRFVINYDGKTTHCSHNQYDYYDNHINPLFTGDEVRTKEVSCESMLNTSQHNATTAGSYSIVYDYRADGRPRSCLVQQNGKNVSKLLFEYQ